LLCPQDENVFAYTRDTEQEHLLVVCNFSGNEQPFAVPEAFENAQLLLSNYMDRTGVLRPYEAYMLCW
jgi:glycosidase